MAEWTTCIYNKEGVNKREAIKESINLILNHYDGSTEDGSKDLPTNTIFRALKHYNE
eukprot:SAG11_NODE_12114_length_721_cov_1.040193_3_plen_56_part_01